MPSKVWTLLKAFGGILLAVLAGLASVILMKPRKSASGSGEQELETIREAEKKREKIMEEVKKAWAQGKVVDKKIEATTTEAEKKIDEVLNDDKDKTVDDTINDFTNSW